MRFLVLFFLFVTSAYGQQHCGYDFTSHIVIDVHENGKTVNIQNLKITIVDSLGNAVINENNRYSFKQNNAPLIFVENYKIEEAKSASSLAIENKAPRWFYSFAKDNYILVVVNEFPIDRFQVKIEDIDKEENGGYFNTVFVPLNSSNLYVLCSDKNKASAMQFGRRLNKPVSVVLEKG